MALLSLIISALTLCVAAHTILLAKLTEWHMGQVELLRQGRYIDYLDREEHRPAWVRYGERIIR